MSAVTGGESEKGARAGEERTHQPDTGDYLDVERIKAVVELNVAG